MTDTKKPMPAVDRSAASRAAVAARRARADVKARLAAGEISGSTVLADSLNPENAAAASLRVSEFLRSLPGVGVTKAAAAMSSLEIAEAKRLGGLGTRQRTKLTAYLAGRERNRSAESPSTSHLVVLAGPTAVGKGAVSTYIREHYPSVMLSVSATTRAPRPGEIDGVSYHFVSDEEFDRLVDEDQLLEWATVHNSYRYGTPRAPIEAALAEGRSVILEIDIQGARQVRTTMPEARLVFLLPPTWEELVRRLVGRGTESSEEQQRRLATAKVELMAQDEFDYRVVNHTVSEAAAEVVDLTRISAGS